MVTRISTPPALGLPFGTVRGSQVYLNPNGIDFLTGLQNAAQGASASIPDSAMAAFMLALTAAAPPDPFQTMAVTTDEVFVAGAMGHCIDNSGAAHVVNANATDTTKPCDCFLRAAFGSGVLAVAYFAGHVIHGLSGLSPGATYYLGTSAGAITTTAPNTAGNGRQVVGKANATGTALLFLPGTMIAV